jgi:hypothetical protein
MSFLVICFVSSSQGEEFKERAIDAIKASQAPKIDGKLDDDCWKNAPKATTFVDPYTENPVSEQTEVMMLYDEKALYLAFQAHDSQPQEILAKETKRDGDPKDDDYVEVILDPFHNHKDRSIFTVNAIGTQFSEIAGGRAEKTEWKGDWKATVGRTENGWTAELAIPWNILDYPSTDKAATMGLNFARHQQRLRTKSYWSNIGRMNQNFFENDGHLRGVILPSKERKLKILTYGFAGSEEGHSEVLRGGLDVRYQPTSSTNILYTINPDFSNVEQEVETIDFSYFARFYADKRPFFQEGEGMFGFEGDVKPFYSRNISYIDTGLKLYGKAKKTSFGVMDVADLDQWNTFMLSMRQDMGKTSSGTVYLVRKDEEAESNQILWLLGNTRWKAFSMVGGWGGSLTEGNGGDGTLSFANLSWSKKNLRTWISGGYLTPEYQSAAGFVAYEDLKGANLGVTYNNERFLGNNYYGVGITAFNFNRYNGEDYFSGIQPWMSFRFRQGANRSYGAFLNFETSRFGEFSDWTTSLKPDLSYRYESYSFNLGANLSYGRRQEERYTFIKPEVGFSLGKGNRLAARYITELLWHKESGRQHIIWLNFNITPERSLGSRIVLKNGKVNSYLSYRQAVRKGIDGFLIFGDPNAEEFEKRALLKLVVPIW